MPFDIIVSSALYDASGRDLARFARWLQLSTYGSRADLIERIDERLRELTLSDLRRDAA